MLKIKRKIIAYFLLVAISFSTVFSSYSITADASSILPIGSAIYVAARTVLSWFGIVPDDDLMTSVASEDFFQEAIQNMIEQNQIRENENGTITFSENAARQLRDLFEEYLSSTPESLDVTWMPVVSSDDLPSDWFQSTTTYNQYRSYADNKPYSYICYSLMNGSRYWLYADVSDDYLRVSNNSYTATVFNQINLWSGAWGTNLNGQTMNYLSLLGSDGLSSKKTFDTAYGFHDGIGTSVPANMYVTGYLNLIYPFTVVNGFYGQTAYQGSGFYVRGCDTDAASFVPVFKDASAFMRWITGQGNYYRFNSSYKGGDITIDPNADYSKIMDAIQDSIRQSVANGEAMSNLLANMQTAFSKTLAEISGTLGDISDDTQAMNEWLEKIYYKLIEIYDPDEDSDSALSSVLASLRGIGTLFLAHYDRTHKDIEHFQLIFETMLYAVNENLKDNNTILGDIRDRLDDIYKKMKAMLFVDTVDTAIDLFTKVWDSISDWIGNKLQILDVVSEASQIYQIMKTKFPFSIPWDVYSILLMFDAPAKPPVIRLHFEFPMLDDYVYDYEYVMDDESWSNLAAFCRFFLTIGYEITLMHLTQKLYASGLFDIPSIGKKKR